jgi:hypothetical protein
MRSRTRYPQVVHVFGQRTTIAELTLDIPVDTKDGDFFTDEVAFIGEAVRNPADSHDEHLAYLLSLERALEAAARAVRRRAEGRIKMNDDNAAKSARAKMRQTQGREPDVEEKPRPKKSVAEKASARKMKPRVPPPHDERCVAIKSRDGNRCTHRALPGRRSCKKHGGEK